MTDKTILAIETTAQACSVAVSNGEQCFSEHQVAPRQQGALVFPMMDSLIKRAGLSFEDIDCLALSYGPGSFTGIRIATSVIQALSFAWDVPVVGVSSMAVMAQTFWRQKQVNEVYVILDARQNEVYLGHYAVVDGIMRAKQSDKIVAPEQIVVELVTSDVCVVGEGWTSYHDKLPGNVQAMTHFSDVLPHAEALIDLAKHEVEQGNYLADNAILPVYLREQVVKKPG